MRIAKKRMAILLSFVMAVSMFFAGNAIVTNAEPNEEADYENSETKIFTESEGDSSLTADLTNCTLYYRLDHTTWTEYTTGNTVTFDSGKVFEIKIMKPEGGGNITTSKLNNTDIAIDGGGPTDYEATPQLSSWGGGYNLPITAAGSYTLQVEVTSNPPGGGGGGSNPGQAYILAQTQYIGFRDFYGNIYGNFLASPEASQYKEEFGYVQYTNGEGGASIPSTWEQQNNPEIRRILDGLDWTEYTWKDFNVDPSVEGAISSNSAMKVACYRLPDDADTIRVVSKSNYWCDLQSKSGQDNGYGYHAILLNNGIIKKDRDCTPDEIANGTKVTVNVYKVDKTSGSIISFHPHSILWYNDAEAAERRGGKDAIITGGTVEFVSCSMPNSSDPFDGIIGRPEDTDLKDGPSNRVIGGQCSAREGAILTLRFIPDYGYQFKKAEINGNPVTPQEDDYTFQFKFPQGTFHLSVTFEPGEDKASGSAAGVGEVQAVSGTEGDDSINGNLMLAGAAATPSAEQQEAMEDAAEASSDDLNIIDGAYIDLSLQSYAEKGDTTDYWSKKIEETKKDVTVTIKVTDAVAARIEAAGETCSVVRAHGSSNPTYSVLPAIYNKSAKTISFASNQFSTFAIATGGSEDEIPTGPSTWQDKEKTEGFIYRLYNVAMLREPDEGGYEYWNDGLTSKTETAADVAKQFFFCDEFKNQDYTDAQFVKFLYCTIFGRDASAEEVAYWVGLIQNGMSREYIFKNFAESAEFTDLCAFYDVERGNVELTAYRDQNIEATGFVARLYKEMMGRSFDGDGIEYWCGELLTGNTAIEDIIADGFLHSPEFVQANVSDEEFITRMYSVMLNRVPDEAGLAYWVECLANKTETRESIIYSFTGSTEFGGIKAKIGL